MKKLLAILILVGSALFTAGCADNGPAVAEDVTKRMQSAPPEQRFQWIKEDKGIGLVQKDAAIDNLPVDDAQKAKWKQELRQSAEGGQPPSRSGAPQAGGN